MTRPALLLYRLVMRAVDRQVGGSGDATQQRAGIIVRMTRLVRGFGAACEGAGNLVGDVLDQGAAETTFSSCWPPQMPSTAFSGERARVRPFEAVRDPWF